LHLIRNLCIWISWSRPELLAFNDAHGDVVWVGISWHERVGGGQEAPVHSLGVQELDLVDSGQDNLDIIGAELGKLSLAELRFELFRLGKVSSCASMDPDLKRPILQLQ
jgi:hypothetical protein